MGRISLPQGKGSQMHNRRDYEKYGKAIPDNIDQSRTHLNITLVDKDIREAYQEFFGEALEKYNAKQKRADRRIEDYYDHISKSKNGEKLFYEDVLQWGTKEDFLEHPELCEVASKALQKYINTFEDRNPNLKLIGAYIHLDEASPHLHFDYVPIAHGYKNGLSARNSLDKAMKEMGYVPEKESKRNNATKLWKENERAYFGELCREYGLYVEEERKGRGHSFTVEEYGEEKDKMRAEIVGDLSVELEKTKSEIASNKDKISEQEQELQLKSNKIKNIDAVTTQIKATTKDGIKLEDMTIPEKKNFFGKVESFERTGVFIEDMKPHQIKALIERAKADDGIEQVLNSVQERCEQMISKAKAEAKEIKAAATAERNETVAKAQEIINQQNSIIKKTKEWVANIQNKYNELVEKVRSLLGQKEVLEKEIAEMNAYKGDLEPLRAEYEQLRDGVQIMSGQLDNQITQAKFRAWSSMPFGASYESYRRNGELIALYKDGTIRKVGTNDRGGWDYKTLEDEKNGKCRVGIIQSEERVSVPKSLIQELISSRDKSKAISDNLSNFIQQQSRVDEIRRDRGRSR